jgi:hypothetical protein
VNPDIYDEVAYLAVVGGTKFTDVNGCKNKVWIYKFEVFTLMEMHMVVFWVLTLCVGICLHDVITQNMTKSSVDHLWKN